MLTNEDFIDSLLVDLNMLAKLLIDGNFVAFCGKINEMGKKLVNLKKGVHADIENKNEIIEQLKEQLKNAGMETETIPVDEFVEKYAPKDGVE